MSYEKNIWNNGDKVTSDKLNKIENELEQLDNNKIDREEVENDYYNKNEYDLVERSELEEVERNVDNVCIDQFSKNDLQDLERGNYFHFELSDYAEVLKPIYIRIHTNNEVLTLTIPTPFEDPAKGYIANEEGRWATVDVIDSCYLGNGGTNNIQIDLKSAIEEISEFSPADLDNCVEIEYTVSKSSITFEF